MYRQWQVDDRDITEVLAYRGGIAGTAAATALVSASMLTDAVELPPAALDVACAAGTLSMGVSLVLVHMYVAQIKRTIQV
jgi:uncharacterized integral membrane protein